MKSVHIKGSIQATAANATQGSLRLLLIYDSSPNGAAPNIAALLQDSNAAGATTWNSQLNLTNRERFKIIRDLQTWSDGANTAGFPTSVKDPHKSTVVDMFVKLKGLETVYNGTNGGTISDITSGALFLVAVCDNQVANECELDYTSRLRYYD